MVGGGSECGTRLKNLKDMKTDFETRIANATDPDMTAHFEFHSMKIGVLALVLEAHQTSGFDSAGIVEVYDCCLT